MWACYISMTNSGQQMTVAACFGGGHFKRAFSVACTHPTTHAPSPPRSAVGEDHIARRYSAIITTGASGVARNQCRHDRAVDHAQAGDAVDAQTIVNDGKADPDPDPARSRRMKIVAPNSRAKSSRSASLAAAGPGLYSSLTRGRSAALAASRRANFEALHCAVPIQLRGEVVGLHRRRSQRVRSLDRTCPRDVGRNWHTLIVNPENGCGLAPAMSAESVAEVKLDVRCRRPRQRAGEKAAFES